MAFVPRPLEPIVAKGRGMHVLGFVTSLGQGVNVEPDAEVESAQEVRGAAARKRGRYAYQHGNYRDYASYRHGGTARAGPDPRLGAIVKNMGPRFFEGKEILDIGCNSGQVGIAAARNFGARRVVGVEIDAGLVEDARASAADLDGVEAEFRAEDIVSAKAKRRADTGEPERFDVILALSVTKWIHFYHGDAGIRKLFKRCVNWLRPGGYLVLEPQEWSSYKKKRNLTREISQRVAGIKLRPEAFDDHLVGKGLRRKITIDPPEGAAKNWKRQIRLYRKPRVQSAGEGVLEAATELAPECGPVKGSEPPAAKRRKVADDDSKQKGSKKRKAARQADPEED